MTIKISYSQYFLFQAVNSGKRNLTEFFSGLIKNNLSG